MTTIKPTQADVKALGSIGHVSVIHEMLLRQSLSNGDTVVDATLGNGHDAAKLLEIIGPNGFLYGFDVQSLAIESSQDRLSTTHLGNYKLICDSHANMNAYLPDGIQGFVFNLGYLPKGDKQVTTTWQTTKQALAIAIDRVLPDGFVSVMTYPGHEAGWEEDQAIAAYFSSLDQSKYQVALTQFINQQNNPPKLYWLTKRAQKK